MTTTKSDAKGGETARTEETTEKPSAPVWVRCGLGALLLVAVGLLLGLDAAWPRGYVYAAVGIGVVAVGLDEFSRMAARLGVRLHRGLLIGGGVAIFLLHWAGEAFAALPTGWTLGAGALATVVLLHFCGRILRSRIEGAMETLAANAFGLIYVAVLFAFLTAVRLGWGVAGIIAVVAVCKAGSSGAYFAGKSLGRHRMTPRLSPKKTWEGVAGQFVGAMGVSLLLSISPWALMGPRTALLYGACIAVVAIFGDLAASLLKRQAELDDWGQLLPGFGGIMDMLDDVLFAAPASLAFLRVCEMIGSGG